MNNKYHKESILYLNNLDLNKTFYHQKKKTNINNYEISADKNIPKGMQKVVDNLKIEKKALFVTEALNENVVRAGRNIENIQITTADIVSTLDLVNAGKLVITKEAVKKIEEAYKE